MGKRREKIDSTRSSQTLPPSPSHSFSSSSSSDFEFTISLSPRKTCNNLCPADELFYKGQLLPLHLSPRISMVRTLLLASSSTSSSSDTTTTASRDSTGSSNDSTSSFTSDLALLGECDSSRPSSVTEDDEFKRLHLNPKEQIKKSGNKYFSLSRFSSVFTKDNSNNNKNSRENENVSNSSVKRMSVTAKEVIKKYFKKVKPLYEKISSQKQNTTVKTDRSMRDILVENDEVVSKNERKDGIGSVRSGGFISHSFSGNLRYPRRKSYVSSCPSSMRSSPSHSGVLSKSAYGGTSSFSGSRVSGGKYCDASSMEELQSAIQGAIAHCKNSMVQNKTLISNEI